MIRGAAITASEWRETLIKAKKVLILNGPQVVAALTFAFRDAPV